VNMRPERIGMAALLALFILYGALDAECQENTTDKVAQILRAEDTRTLTEGLISLLDDPDAKIAGRALRGLGRIGDPAGLQMLLEALANPNESLQEEAIFAIGELEDADTLALIGKKPDAQAAAALRGILTDSSVTPSHDVLLKRALAIEALGKMGDAESVDEIVKAGRMCLGGVRDSAPELLSLKSITALVRIGDAAGASFLVEALRAVSPEVRRTAALGLGRMKHAESVPELLDLFNDPDDGVRSAAVCALYRIEAADKAAKALPLLHDPSMNVRIETIRLLSLGSGKEITGALFHHLRRAGGRPPAAYNNEDLEVIKALGRIGGKDAVNLLKGLLNNQNATGIVVRTAYVTCPGVEDKKVLALERSTYAYSALSYVNWSYALSERGGEAGRIGLTRIIDDPAAPVEAKAVALSTLSEQDPSSVEGWALAFISEPGSDPILRAAAAEALGRVQTDAALEALLKAWPSAYKKSDIEVQLSILDAMGMQAKERDLGSFEYAKLKSAIFSGTKDKEHLVRVKAIGLLGDVFGQSYHSLLGVGSEPKRFEYYRSAAELAGAGSKMLIATPVGTILVELDPDTAPLTVKQFLDLADSGTFNGLTFHRVVPDFVIQGGDPRGTGWGSAGGLLPCEIGRGRFVRGSVGMATAGKDTGSSQFFITLSSQPHLDGSYTLFGRVVSGMEIAERIKPGDKIVRMKVSVQKP